jgi:hypothetical protein
MPLIFLRQPLQFLPVRKLLRQMENRPEQIGKRLMLKKIGILKQPQEKIPAAGEKIL